MFAKINNWFKTTVLTEKDFKELQQKQFEYEKSKAFSNLNRLIKSMYDQYKSYVVFDYYYDDDIISLLKQNCLNRNFKILEIPTEDKHFIIYR